MSFRKILFWIHLTVGSCAAVVVLIMSVTGILLMYEKQTIAWVDSGYHSTAGQGMAFSLENLLAKSRQRTGALPSTVTIKSDPAAAAALVFGPGPVVYVDAFSGQPLGEGSKGARGFFRAVTEWHRYLSMSGARRPLGRSITGAVNLGFLFLVVSGAYLWLPRVFAWNNFRAVLWFRSGLSGKARDFNWHNVIGVWCAAPLFLIIISGAIISYPWASNLVYKMAGTTPPAGAPAAGAPPADLPLQGFDSAWQRAAQQVSGWQAVSLRLPASDHAPLVFTIDQGYAGQPQKRGTLTVDRVTGEVIRWETFSSFDAGRQWRTWLRFVHTGEYYGIPGQTAAGIVTLGAAFLAWTGVALAWRRFRAWQLRRRA